ncbi:hypothetical protein DID74_02180, partial [Candidatus Marinamargulisbacteria bacterium SCGC AG-333-B06]
EEAGKSSPIDSNDIPNVAPTVEDVSGTTTTDKPVEITLLGSDDDNDNLTYSIVSEPSDGSIIVSGSSATYSPDKGFSETDLFTYKAFDGNVYSDPATVSITIDLDTDRDGIKDSDDTDDDGDGLLDTWEINNGLDHLLTDTDNNGLFDDQEDMDGDQLTNLQEQTKETDPTQQDSDNDNVPDAFDKYPMDNTKQEIQFDYDYIFNEDYTHPVSEGDATILDNITITINTVVEIPAFSSQSTQSTIVLAGGTLKTNKLDVNTTQTNGSLVPISDLVISKAFNQTGGDIILNVGTTTIEFNTTPTQLNGDIIFKYNLDTIKANQIFNDIIKYNEPLNGANYSDNLPKGVETEINKNNTKIDIRIKYEGALIPMM